MPNSLLKDQRARRPRRRRALALALAATAAVSLLAACSSGGGSGSPKTDPNATVTIWAAPDSLPVVQLYHKTHPNVKVDIQTVARTDFPAKVLLANNTGHGWPDLIFLDMQTFAQVSDTAHNFPLDISKYLPKSLAANYTKGAFASCTVDGKLECLRNDLAPDVLWYNSTLLHQFGYQVPTTFEQYEQLSDQVAAQHPGYIMGVLDGGLGAYYQASGCPIAQLTGANSLKVDVNDKRCTEVTQLLDHMIANKTLSTDSVGGTDLAKQVSSNNLLMLIGPAWFGQFVFGGTSSSTWYKTAEHQLAAAAPMSWAGQPTLAGSNGGGAWVVSRHAKNPATAVKIATWVATSAAHAKVAPSLPAYIPSAQIWSKTLDANKIYTTNPYPVFQKAAGEISTSVATLRFDPVALFTTTVLAAAQQGKTVASAMPGFIDQLTKTAKSYNYTVSN